MPIDIMKLRGQLADFAGQAADSRTARERVAGTLARVFEADFDHAQWVAACARASTLEGAHWNGALFNLGEGVADLIAFGSQPARYVLLSADGSQILPNRHAAAPYYLIQVGSGCLVYGEDPDAPGVASAVALAEEKWVELVSDPARLFADDRDGDLVSASDVSTERDMREIEWIAGLCEACAGVGYPVIAIIDGQIVPFALLGRRAGDRRSADLTRRLTSALDRIRRSGAWIAGYVDRPNSGALARACSLAGESHASLTKRRLLDAEQALRGISDRHILLDRLQPGHRTGLFSTTWRVNDTIGEHAMRACYLNVSDEGAPAGEHAAIARLEMPDWCARPQVVNAVCAVLHRHAEMGGGWPLILKIAHEAALVSLEDQRELERLVEQELMEGGIFPERSFKQQAKDLQ